ncbi:hemocyte protein-glutamine gamma-glutamyltransferase-like [Babylonia areolata]|uniref:hemocyte protein-glutamine gamma-glutamyltransferase-like n=1 Tax=Babylonia areolata TaxID=304850 RepID=UPI003FD12666
MGCTCSSGGTKVAPEDEPNKPKDDVVVPPSEPDPSDEETLRVEGVDFRVAANTRDHRTDRYDVTEGPDGKLVVRRGQPFIVQLRFSRPYSQQKDDLRLLFETGEKPDRKKGTQVEFVLSAKDRKGDWGARLTQQADKVVDLKVFTPPHCQVAQWSLKVDVVKRQDEKVSLFRYTHHDPVYVIFNPWCKDDTVYLDSEKEREEYVLNDKGKIYVGSHYRFSAKPWVFGQFTDPVLDCCMYLLDRCKLREGERGNPVHVVRRLTALVNSPDEGGVLSGNWSGDYSGGKSPLSWTGSEPILSQFYKQKTPVKYGQCWVFSGVLTAVCRALGLPARSVTNFSSAHDVDASITIDKFIDENGNPLKGRSRDSVWNFHVWNEVWMVRGELPAGYGGWQACDATPQEESQGVYCCGPCPVRAIKEGEVNLGHDGPFIFAEINADRITWMEQADGTLVKARVDKTVVGKKISTKSLGEGREDLTLCYKHREGSTAERIALRRAQQLSSSPYDYLEEDSPQDVHFQLLYDADNTYVGDKFTLTLQCRNSSQQARTVEGTVSVKTMFYTGVQADDVVRHPFKGVLLEGGKSERVEVMVKEDDYLGKLKDMCHLSFTAMAKVTETGQIFTETSEARLRKPHLQIQGPSTAKVGEKFEVQVTFNNPLSQELTACYLELEAAGFTKANYPQSDVDGKGTFSHSLKLTPNKKGPREIVFIFNSKQLEDINGTHAVFVV